MAAFHFDLRIANGESDALVAPMGQELFEAFLELATFNQRENYGEVQEAWSDHGHQLTFIDGEPQHLTVRIDLRESVGAWEAFVVVICQLVEARGLQFLIEDGSSVRPDIALLRDAASNAPAVAAIELLRHNARRGITH